MESQTKSPYFVKIVQFEGEFKTFILSRQSKDAKAGRYGIRTFPGDVTRGTFPREDFFYLAQPKAKVSFPPNTRIYCDSVRYVKKYMDLHPWYRNGWQYFVIMGETPQDMFLQDEQELDTLPKGLIHMDDPEMEYTRKLLTKLRPILKFTIPRDKDKVTEIVRELNKNFTITSKK